MRRTFLFLVLVAACTGSDPDLAGAPADAGPASDASGGTDAGPRADAETDAGPSTYCTSRSSAAWCEDFDTTKSIDEIGPATNQSDLKKGSVTTMNFVSSPRAFLFEMPAGRQPVQSTYLSRAFKMDKNEMVLDLDFRLPLAAPAPGQIVQLLILKRYTAEAQLNRQCSAPDDGGAPDCRYVISTCVDGICKGHDVGKPLKALTEWSHLTLKATFASTGHVTFVEDGAELVSADDPLLSPSTPASEPTSATAAIAVVAGTSTAFALYIDNVVVELP